MANNRVANLYLGVFMEKQAHGADQWFAEGSQETEEVEKYYNKWASDYDKNIRDYGYNAPEQTAQLLKKFNTLEGTICDAGCGSGLTGQALKETCFDSIIGFDLSPDFAKVALKKNVYEEVDIVNMHERPFKYKDDQFAGTICIGTLTYIEDVPPVLREFARITKPGGMVIFTHRTDMIDDPKFQENLKRIETDKIWEEVLVSDPQPYLPGNKDFSDKINIVYYAFRVL